MILSDLDGKELILNADVQDSNLERKIYIEINKSKSDPVDMLPTEVGSLEATLLTQSGGQELLGAS